MPTYDYQCGACGHELEIFHSMSDAPKRKCPGCGRLKLVRQIGAGGGIIFKGSGFYETDYRSASYKEGAKAESSSSSKGADAKSKDSSKSPKKDSSESASTASGGDADSGSSPKSKPASD